MVEGEILIAEGKIDSGMEQLRAAIQKEDALKYDAPAGWLIRVRHLARSGFDETATFCRSGAGLSR